MKSSCHQRRQRTNNVFSSRSFFLSLAFINVVIMEASERTERSEIKTGEQKSLQKHNNTIFTKCSFALLIDTPSQAQGQSIK